MTDLLGIFQGAEERPAVAVQAVVAEVDGFDVYVFVPSFDATNRWGPLLGINDPGGLARDDECLVVFDEAGDPWYVSPGLGGGGGGDTDVDATASATTTPAGSNATVHVTEPAPNLFDFAFGIPRGDTGAQGAQGAQGPAGTAGSKWYDGQGIPPNSLGVTGDFYLETISGDVYERYASPQNWQRDTNIKGPQGPTGGNATVPIDPWHVIGAAGEPAFVNGWGHTASEPLRFRKDPLGRVWIRGATTGGATGSIVFTLPAGYRPALTNNQYFDTLISNGAAGGVVTVVPTSGAMTATFSPGNSTVWVDISFDTETVSAMPTGPQGPKGDKGDKGDTGGNATVPFDAWHTVGAAGEPAFSNGYTAQPGYAVRFTKDPLGKVYLTGVLKPGTNGTPAFTLPVGYRPFGTDVAFTVPTSTGQGGISVLPSGAVQPSVGAAVYVYLDGVEFDSGTVTAMPTGPQGPQGPPGIPIPVVTSLPPTTGLPDGYEVYFRFSQTVGNPAGNAEPRMWHLRYDASQTGAYKWVPVGAQEPVMAYDPTQRSIAAAIGYVDFGQQSNSMFARAPIGGLYRIRFGASYALSSTVAQNLYVALNIGGVWGQYGSVGSGQPATWSTASAVHRAIINAGGDAYWGFYATAAGTVNATGRYIELHPVWLSGPT